MRVSSNVKIHNLLYVAHCMAIIPNKSSNVVLFTDVVYNQVAVHTHDAGWLIQHQLRWIDLTVSNRLRIL